MTIPAGITLQIDPALLLVTVGGLIANARTRRQRAQTSRVKVWKGRK